MIFGQAVCTDSNDSPSISLRGYKILGVRMESTFFRSGGAILDVVVNLHNCRTNDRGMINKYSVTLIYEFLNLIYQITYLRLLK